MATKPEAKVHRMGLRHQETGDLNDEERAAWHRPHHCTDIPTLLLFIAGLVGMGWTLNYARQNGDFRRLYYGLNFYGELCGVDKGVAAEPFLFWCTKPGGALPTDLAAIIEPSSKLDLQHPICVSSCPKGPETHHACYQSKQVQPVSKDALTGTFVENVTYNFRLVQDYGTRDLAGHYCLPTGSALLKQLRGKLEGGSQAAMLHAGEVLSSWAALLASGALAVVLGYLYLFFVGRLVDELIYLFVGLAVLLPVLAGGAMLYGVYADDVGTEFLEHYDFAEYTQRIPSTGDKRLDFAAAAALIAVGLLIGIAACCLRHSIKLIIGCIEAATEALFAMPTLLLAPLISVILKVALVLLEFAGLAWLMSCGEVHRFDIMKEYVPGGVSRSFTFSDDQVRYIAFYAFMAVWVLEVAFALEQFVLAYSTQLWFFKDYVDGRKGLIAFPMVRGFFVGLEFHLGTLALGALLLTILEAIHFVLAVIYKRVHEAEEEAGTCSVSKILAGCCCCCLSCFECFIRFMNKNAYIVTAVESEPFFSAAQIAFNVVANEIAAIGGLSVALKFFMVGGLVTITSLGAYLTWILVHSLDVFTDPKSAHFVAAPEYVTAAAGGIAFIVAGTFMVMFDTVADTILFCWALDRKYRSEHGMPPGNNVPGQLRELLDAEGTADLLERGS